MLAAQFGIFLIVLFSGKLNGGVFGGGALAIVESSSTATWQ